MKKVIYVLLAFAVGFFGFKYFYEKYASSDDTEVAEQESEEWKVLFDGTSFDGWHEYNTDVVTSQWKIEDGAMVFTPDPDIGGRNSLITDDNYTDFILSLEWKISEAGNSGFFWGVYEDPKFGEPYSTGPEIQILDNDKHADGKIPSHRAGSLYDMIVPSAEVVKPVGEWNICLLEINYKTNYGSVTLNGTKIVEFPVKGPEWDAMIAASKFKDWEGFAEYPTGKIGLQDHSDVVSYRNIKIKEL